MSTERNERGQHPWRRVLVWFLAPLTDKWVGLSLTRFIAIYICVLVGQGVFIQHHSLAWIDFWFMLAAIATAFGVKTFTLLLERTPPPPTA